jgi:hypothetical protein
MEHFKMACKDPWTDPDPKRGDFDAYLKTVDPRHIEVHEGSRSPTTPQAPREPPPPAR